MNDLVNVSSTNEVSLYGMVAELQQIESLMSDEIFLEDTEENQAAIAQRNQELIALIQSKTDACCGYNQSLDDFIEAIEKRAKELSELKSKVKNKQDRFHKYILSAMDVLGMQKINGSLYTIAYRKPTKSVEILDENLLPAQYVKIVEETNIDKKQIGDDLKNGMEVPGATLKDGKRSLSFKAGK